MLQLKGQIDDCSCNVDTVDHFNNMKIFPRLQSLLSKDYFRFYKVSIIVFLIILHTFCSFKQMMGFSFNNIHDKLCFPVTLDQFETRLPLLDR